MLENAELNLSTCPTWPTRLFFLANWTNSEASSSVEVIGFSINTWMFFSRKNLAIS